MNEEIVKDAVERTFNVSPDSVYGVLAALLLIGLIYALIRIAQKDRRLYKLNTDTIKVLTSLDKSIQDLKQQSDNMSTQFKEKLENTHDHIVERINDLKTLVNEKDT